MKFEIKAYNLQELGQRQNQEDSLFPALGKSTAEDRLFILCDGMGGHEKGEVASATVCEVMSKTILSLWKPSESLTDEILQKALNAAYDALDAKDNGGERRMGTTMTLLCLHAGGATVAHIGDSRIYQLRPASNGNPARIVFRTEDHSLVNALVKIGEITEEEAKTHPQRNVITRAMQPGQDRAQADIAHLTDIQPGDYFYMCSDGMLEETSDENILYIITKPEVSDGKKIEMLRDVTMDNSDNHTAHLIFMEKVEGTIVPPVGAVNEGSMSATTHRENNAAKKNVAAKAFCAVLALLLIGVGLVWGLSKKEQKNPDTQNNSQEVSFENGTLRMGNTRYDMVKINAGTFTMGAGKNTRISLNCEHQVTLTKDYYIGKTEVTQAFWKAVMGSNPSSFKGDNRPVECVSWNDCQEFISKLNAITGKNFRLPTEAEWEFAALGGNKSQHYQYSGSNTLSEVAWYDDNSGRTTHNVGTKKPNELGIYDMSGNVWEWCSDWYGDYSSAEQIDPQGPPSGFGRLNRGGSQSNLERNCHTSFRCFNDPGNCDINLGLRLALTE